MKVEIKTPTKAYIVQATEEERTKFEKELTYRNTSVQFQLNKTMKSDWLKRNKPMEWQAKVDELKSKVKNTVMFSDENGIFIRPGSIPSLSLKIDYENKIKMPTAKPMAWYKKPSFDPYPYQLETANLMIEAMYKGMPASAQLATGLGKSYILALITKQLGVKTLIVTPSTSIFYEILEFFQSCFGVNKVGTLGDGKKKTDRQIIIAIAKSVSSLKEGTKHYEDVAGCQLVLGDESHTLPAATLDSAFHGVLSDVPLRGFLSGTQTRGDGSLPLLNSIIGDTVIDRNLSWGIENGYLSKLDFTFVRVPTTQPHFWSGDPAEMKRKHFLYNDNILEFAARTASAAARSMGLSSLILVEEIEQISLLASKLKDVPFTYVHGNTVDKSELQKYRLENRDLKEEIEKFNKGEVKIFIGTKCVSTGTNFFPTHFTFNLQGGSSEIATKQGVLGRSTRLLEKSRYSSLHKPKDFSRVFDFDVSVDAMEKSFLTRVDFYKEANGPIKWINFK